METICEQPVPNLSATGKKGANCHISAAGFVKMLKGSRPTARRISRFSKKCRKREKILHNRREM